MKRSLENADVDISNGDCKDVLQSLMKLFVRVRSINFASDIVQKTKLKLATLSNAKKSLRQNLKKTAEEFDKQV